jgi:hypothetical protein
MRAPDPPHVALLTDTEWNKIRKILASSGVDADTVKTGAKKYSAQTRALLRKIRVARGEDLDPAETEAGSPGTPLRRALDNYRQTISSWNWAAARKRRANDLRKIIKAIDALDLGAAEEISPTLTLAAQQALASLREFLAIYLEVDKPRRGQAPEKEMRKLLWVILVETWKGFEHRRPTRANLVAFILAVTPPHFLNASKSEADLKAVANFLDKPFHGSGLVKSGLDRRVSGPT